MKQTGACRRVVVGLCMCSACWLVSLCPGNLLPQLFLTASKSPAFPLHLLHLPMVRVGIKYIFFPLHCRSRACLWPGVLILMVPLLLPPKPHLRPLRTCCSLWSAEHRHSYVPSAVVHVANEAPAGDLTRAPPTTLTPENVSRWHLGDTSVISKVLCAHRNTSTWHRQLVTVLRHQLIMDIVKLSQNTDG